MIDQETLQHSVACERFSPFKLRLALDWQTIELPLRLVEDAWQRFASSPIAAIASSLEKEVIASGIYSTHTIEGGELSEEETANTLAQPPRSPDDNRRAVLNLKTAYEHAQAHSSAADWRLSPAYIQDIHRQITADIPHPYNTPGQYRNNRPPSKLSFLRNLFIPALTPTPLPPGEGLFRIQALTSVSCKIVVWKEV